MPLDVSFTSHETNQKLELEPIILPNMAVMYGLVDGIRHLIFVKPQWGDYTAQVHLVDEESVIVSEFNGKTYYGVDLNSDTLDKLMLAGSSHEIDNVCINDELGRLALQHTAPHGLIISQN